MSDLQKIKEQVSIYDVAESLLRLEKQDGKYKYPGERTASIKLYPENNRFHDFGRNVNGDIFDLTPKNKTIIIIEQNKKEIFMDGCNENVIEFMTNDTRATLSFSQGRYKSTIRRLAEKHPEDCQIIADNEDGSICAHVPVSWLRISPPRQYTEEQRQQMGERLRQNRSENTVTQG